MISAHIPRLIWTGSGATSSITLSDSGQPIVFNDPSEIVVRQLNTSSLDEAALTLGIDYSLSGYPVASSSDPAATLTRIAGNLATGFKWAILRVTPAAQSVDLVPGGDFASDDVEQIGNTNILIAQEMKEQIARALLLSIFSSGVSASLPTPAALNYLRWNAGASALENAASVDLTGTTVSSFMQSLLVAASAAAGRTTLGLAALAILNTVGTSQIDNDAVTYAKMQNISATSRILGRRTAAAGDTEECTLSQILDFIGGAAQGDILYRGASSWARLGAGTNLQFLQTPGAGGNPLWAFGGRTLLTSGTVSAAATLDLVLTAYTGFRAIEIVLESFVPATDDVELWMRFSTDGGSNYDAGAAAYAWINQRGRSGATAPVHDVQTGDAKIAIAGIPNANFSASNVASEGGVHSAVTLFDQTVAAFAAANYATAYYAANTESIDIRGSGRRLTAQDTDAVRFLFETGNIASGKYAVYGVA